FFFSSRRRHTRFSRDWSSDVCSSDLAPLPTSGKFGLDLPRPMTKYGLYGEMAQGGVMAALLAHRGFTADTTVLDGERGLWRMAGSLDCDWAALTDGIGSRWLVDEASYKSYPGCRFLNPAIDIFRSEEHTSE